MNYQFHTDDRYLVEEELEGLFFGPNEPNVTIFAIRVHKARIRLGATIEQLADLCLEEDVFNYRLEDDDYPDRKPDSIKILMKYEDSGSDTVPGGCALTFRLARVLKVPFTYLIGETNDIAALVIRRREAVLATRAKYL